MVWIWSLQMLPVAIECLLHCKYINLSNTYELSLSTYHFAGNFNVPHRTGCGRSVVCVPDLQCICGDWSGCCGIDTVHSGHHWNCGIHQTASNHALLCILRLHIILCTRITRMFCEHQTYAKFVRVYQFVTIKSH